jgi:carboxyl-terminal processing protease
MLCAAYVKYNYVDSTFNGVDWEQSFQAALKQSREATDAAEVRRMTDELVAKLGDPYTRVMDPQAAAIFNAEQKGQVCDHV